MKAIGQMQAFLGNGDQHVSADRDPDLRLDRVLVGAIKRLDAQVLLDPFANNSTCQRWRYRSEINSGLNSKLLVKNVMRLPVSSLTTTRRSVAG